MKIEKKVIVTLNKKEVQAGGLNPLTKLIFSIPNVYIFFDIVVADLIVQKKYGLVINVDFYTQFPMLLLQGAVIKDVFIASNLHLSIDHLRHIRSSLIKRVLLPPRK